MAYPLTLEEQSLMGFLVEHGKRTMEWADEDCEDCHGFGFHVYKDGPDEGDCHEEPCDCWIKNVEIEKAQVNADWQREHDDLPWED